MITKEQRDKEVGRHEVLLDECAKLIGLVERMERDSDVIYAYGGYEPMLNLVYRLEESEKAQASAN